jgi:hypothetical protein
MRKRAAGAACVVVLGVAGAIVLGTSGVGAVEPQAGPGSALPVTAVAASGDDGDVAANAVDGDLSTRWSAEGDGQWISFDLGAAHTVDSVSVAWYLGDERTAEFDVQLSADGTSWQTALPHEKSSGKSRDAEAHEFTAASARYVRILGHGNDDNEWNSITEVSIGDDSTPPTTPTTTTTTDPTPPPSGDCTVHVPSPDDVDQVKPGDVVCIDGDLAGDRLNLTKGGTADAPVTYLGKDGQAVGGIDIDGSYIVADGYTMDGPSAPGVELTGDHLTLQNTHISNPTGGDGDGIRFFGTDLTIRGNVVHGTSNDNGHADCMQTFASDTPASHDVLIEGNRCEDIDNMGLMAEGPNDGEGDGEGHTYNITLKDNYYLSKEASQEIMIEDIQHLTLTGNTFDGSVDHAIGLDIGSTDAHIDDTNTFSPDISCKVGMDDTSRDGYEGPESECGP